MLMGRDNRRLHERVWELFNKRRLTPAEIDETLCLLCGTAKTILLMRWERMV